MPNVESYAQHAITLATDRPRQHVFAILRAAMRNRLRATPACNFAATCLAMEAFSRSRRAVRYSARMKNKSQFRSGRGAKRFEPSATRPLQNVLRQVA